MLATITGVYDDGVSIRIDGENSASLKHYRVNRAATYAVGDRVCVDKVGSTYVVAYPIGRIGTGSGSGGGGGSETIIIQPIQIQNSTFQLIASGWTYDSTTGLYAQTKSSGAQNGFSSIIGPADRVSAERWTTAEVFCEESGSDLIFTASSAVEISVNMSTFPQDYSYVRTVEVAANANAWQVDAQTGLYEFTATINTQSLDRVSVGPADRVGMQLWIDCGIFAEQDGTDLVLTATDAPNADMLINVLILEAGT